MQMEMVRSAQPQAGTPPKQVEPVTTSLPDGASPVTGIARGLAESVLTIVMVPALGPKVCGWNRMGTGNESPEPILIG